MHYKQYKTILSPKNGMNIYRGCTHGCIYCDSRSTCYQMQHDFEDVEIKTNAPEMLEEELRKKRKKGMIVTGAMTDSYMPLESEIQYTRRCLEIIEKYGFGVSIQTKSNLILRDLDLLKRINEKSKCVVQITLTTHNEDLCKILEPGVCTSKERFEVLKIMKENGIPTVVWLCPLLPFINDTEDNLLGIMDYCIRAEVRGILNFGIGVTLREGDREYFYAALDRHFPGLKEQYRQKYGNRYEVTSDNNDKLMRIFHTECKKHAIMCDTDEIFTYIRTFPDRTEQLSLFE
ncbi:MAG: radical SAM protein [Dehalococcoidales bacterium]|nr:radical SAM protein [Dehalococcoidales bacterium]